MWNIDNYTEAQGLIETMKGQLKEARHKVNLGEIDSASSIITTTLTNLDTLKGRLPLPEDAIEISADVVGAIAALTPKSEDVSEEDHEDESVQPNIFPLSHT